MDREIPTGSHAWSEDSIELNLQPFLTAHLDRQAAVHGALRIIADNPYALALEYFGSPDYPEKIYSHKIPDSNVEIVFGISAQHEKVLVLVAVVDWDDVPS